MSKHPTRKKQTGVKKRRTKKMRRIAPVTRVETSASSTVEVSTQESTVPQELNITEEPFTLPDLGRFSVSGVLVESAERMADSEYRAGQLDHRLYLSEEKLLNWREKALLGVIEMLDLFQAVLGSFQVYKDSGLGQSRLVKRKKKGEPITREGMANLRTFRFRLKEYLRDMGVEEIEASVSAPLDIEQHEVLKTVRRKRMENGTIVKIVKPGYRLGQRILRKTLIEVVRNT